MELLLLLLIVFLVAAAVGGLGRGRGFYRRPRGPIYDDDVVYEEPVPRRRRFF
jgi:hypothetical protein